MRRLARFGAFELDVSAGELRRQGRKINLQQQPFQVLALLVRRAGEVVTREELQQALWPADTFVEFDQGLNTAIGKIRKALSDSADKPRFIETLPRKGYRFIAPVSVTEEEVESSAPAPRPLAVVFSVPTAAERPVDRGEFPPSEAVIQVAIQVGQGFGLSAVASDIGWHDSKHLEDPA